MNCPYCNKFVRGMTGLQEALNFRKHLNKCRKAPAALLPKRLASDGAGVWKAEPYNINDALEIRAASGQ